jgi:parallel beta-helix repeat protein
MRASLRMLPKLMLVVLILINASHAYAGLIVVPDQHPTIQAAVDAASNGDVIFVRSGIYQESVSVIGFASLTLKAEAGVLVNPTPMGWTAGFSVMSSGVTIDGFEIAYTNLGIKFEGSFNKFANNYIHDMTFSEGGPYCCWNGGWGIGLWSYEPSNYNVIVNNVIEDVDVSAIHLHDWTEPGGAGGFVNTGNTVAGNRIRFAHMGGIDIRDAESTTISKNTLSDVGNTGISVWGSQVDTRSNENVVAHNSINGVHTSELQPSAGIAVGPYWVHTNIHHNEIQNITNAHPGYGSYGIMLSNDVKDTLVHHNTVVICSGMDAYSDEGTQNRDYKNSWN